MDCNSVLEYAKNDKSATITLHMITKVIEEVFCNEVRKRKLERKKKVVTVYTNLAKKSVQVGEESTSDMEEWECLQNSVQDLVDKIGPNWSSLQDKDTITLLHYENLRINEQVAVCEITLKRKCDEVDIMVQYHDRCVPNEIIKDIMMSCQGTKLEKVQILTKLMERCYVCMGIECNENQPELYNVPLKKCKISATMSATTSEERIFSPVCEVLTNSGEIGRAHV